MSFDVLQDKIRKMKNPTVAGLDARIEYVPEHIRKAAFAEYGVGRKGAAEAIYQFNVELIDALCDIVPAVKPQSAYYESIVAFCDLGYDLIYAPGNQYTDAILQAAEEYPNIAFPLLNGGADTPAKAANSNVTSLLPDSQQVGWIAGILAGLMTETGKVAFIGGMEIDTTKGKYAGFVESAEYVGQQEGKTVEALDVVYSGDFSASDKGIEFAKAMMDQGADVFFGDASAVDSGARQAIDEANAASGSVKVYDIAQPGDFLGQNECIIGSQVTDNSGLVGLCMEAVENGTFGGETIFGTMQNGVLSCGKLSDLVPADVQEKYNSYISQVMDGTFMQ